MTYQELIALIKKLDAERREQAAQLPAGGYLFYSTTEDKKRYEYVRKLESAVEALNLAAQNHGFVH